MQQQIVPQSPPTAPEEENHSPNPNAGGCATRQQPKDRAKGVGGDSAKNGEYGFKLLWSRGWVKKLEGKQVSTKGITRKRISLPRGVYYMTRKWVDVGDRQAVGVRRGRQIGQEMPTNLY